MNELVVLMMRRNDRELSANGQNDNFRVELKSLGSYRSSSRFLIYISNTNHLRLIIDYEGWTIYRSILDFLPIRAVAPFTSFPMCQVKVQVSPSLRNGYAYTEGK